MPGVWSFLRVTHVQHRNSCNASPHCNKQHLRARLDGRPVTPGRPVSAPVLEACTVAVLVGMVGIYMRLESWVTL